MKTFIFISLIVITQLSFAQIDRKGNGGNEVALDFLNSAKRMLSIYGGELRTFPQLKGKNLGKVLNKTNILISSTPLQVELRGVNQDVTAVNFKSPSTIIINEKRWLNIKENAVKEALALHELLSLVGVERTGVYFISKNYLVKNGVQCLEDLCESQKSVGADETFCRFQNNWQISDITSKHRFACKNKTSEFEIYCDLWKDPTEFNGNKIDALGGTWTPKDKRGGFLNYTYPDAGGIYCTYENIKDE